MPLNTDLNLKNSLKMSVVYSAHRVFYILHCGSKLIVDNNDCSVSLVDILAHCCQTSPDDFFSTSLVPQMLHVFFSSFHKPPRPSLTAIPFNAVLIFVSCC